MVGVLARRGGGWGAREGEPFIHVICLHQSPASKPAYGGGGERDGREGGVKG